MTKYLISESKFLIIPHCACVIQCLFELRSFHKNSVKSTYYSVSTLETTIFPEIGKNFRCTFLSSYVHMYIVQKKRKNEQFLRQIKLGTKELISRNFLSVIPTPHTRPVYSSLEGKFCDILPCNFTENFSAWSYFCVLFYKVQCSLLTFDVQFLLSYDVLT